MTIRFEDRALVRSIAEDVILISALTDYAPFFQDSGDTPIDEYVRRAREQTEMKIDTRDIVERRFWTKMSKRATACFDTFSAAVQKKVDEILDEQQLNNLKRLEAQKA